MVILFSNLVRITLSKCIIFSCVAMITACGSEDNNETKILQNSNLVVVKGGVVKGPLTKAKVFFYELDTTQTGFKGTLVASTITDDAAAFNDIELDKSLLYLVETTSSNDTVDITTGTTPILSSFRTIVTSKMLDTGTPVYATPYTTIVVDLAIANADSGSALYPGDGILPVLPIEFEHALFVASKIVKSTLGFGLTDNLDIFLVQPLINDHTVSIEAQNNVAIYRTAIETFTSVIGEIASVSGVSSDTVFQNITTDLFDAVIDGANYQTPISIDINVIFSVLSTQEPGNLTIPNTDNIGPPLTPKDTLQILTEELSITRFTPLIILPNYVNIPSAQTDSDIDKDLVLNISDNCPDVPNVEQADFDNDSFGDTCDLDDDNDGLTDTIENAIGTDPFDPDTDDDGIFDGLDIFPFDPNESMDSDSDGIGDNIDNCPTTPNSDQLDKNKNGIGDVCEI